MLKFDNEPLVAFLEEAVKDLITSNAEQVAICARLPNGDMHTIYYNCDYPLEMAMLGMQIQADAMFDVMLINAKEIVAAAESEDEPDDAE